MSSLRRVGPWLAELATNAGGLVRAHVPGVGVDPRLRERVALAVAEVNGDRWAAWVHGSWAAYLGDGERTGVEDAVLAHARACAAAGRPLDPAPLVERLPRHSVRWVRAVVAQVELAGVVGTSATRLSDRVAHRDVRDPLRALVDAGTVVAGAPWLLPLTAAAAVRRAATAVAPALPAPDLPDPDDANLLVLVLAESLPVLFGHAVVRTVAMLCPVDVPLAFRSGHTAATLRFGRGRVAVRNGVEADALVLLDGDIEPLLRLAASSLARELAGVRLRPS